MSSQSKKRYWFFLSYARRDGGLYLKKFYDELKEQVRLYTGDEMESIGFFDGENIEPATQWPDELREALQVSRAFVFILSPTYLKRDYCGREWYVFHNRVREYLRLQPPGTKRPPLMFPVLWVPEQVIRAAIPASISRLQYNHEDFGQAYTDLGLLQLRKLGSAYKTQYERFKHKLALSLKQAAEEFDLPQINGLPDLTKTPSAWTVIEEETDLGKSATEPENPPLPPPLAQPEAKQVAAQWSLQLTATGGEVGPRYVEFLYLRGDTAGAMDRQGGCYSEGADWRPFHPDMTESMFSMAIEVAHREGFEYREIRFTGDAYGRIKISESKNRIVVVVTAPSALQDEPTWDLILRLLQQPAQNCIVLLVAATGDAPPSTGRRAQQLKEGLSGGVVERYIENVTSMDAFSLRLADALQRMRIGLVERAEVRKITDQAAPRLPLLKGPDSTEGE